MIPSPPPPIPPPTATQAEENKEWIAKYGYKRWGTSYVDKTRLDEEAGAAPAAAPAASKPAAKVCACMCVRVFAIHQNMGRGGRGVGVVWSAVCGGFIIYHAPDDAAPPRMSTA